MSEYVKVDVGAQKVTDPVNFTHFTARYGRSESNVDLRNRKIELQGTVTPVLDAAGVDTWEGEGGALAPPPYEVTSTEIFRKYLRARGARKQTAARAVRPINTITVKKVQEANHLVVVQGRMEDKSEEQIIADLKLKIEELKRQLAK